MMVFISVTIIITVIMMKADCRYKLVKGSKGSVWKIVGELPMA